MSQIDVDGLLFSFGDLWNPTKYDEWKFYRNRWANIRSGVKAVDVLAIDPYQTAWLIEVKDYTKMDYGEDERPLASELGQVVAHKVFDTLAAMLPAKLNAFDDDEKQFAASMMTDVTRLRVVLHMEQPATRSRLRPRAINPADVPQKLKQLLKSIDPHPAVVSLSAMSALQWTVARP